MIISINKNISRPIYLQIVSQIKEQIRKGELITGDELPSVRELANSLAINMHTVHLAYQKLHEQGFIRMRLGRRAIVSKIRERPDEPDEVESALVEHLKELITDGLLLGISKQGFRRLFDEVLESHTMEAKRNER